TPEIRLGLAPNAGQFALLVVVNAFVGGMIGLERAVVPLLAEREFGLASRTVILSFILGFGVVKALANLIAGGAGDRFGRKPILASGYLAASFGLRQPFVIGVGLAFMGLVLSLLVRETHGHARHEGRVHGASPDPASGPRFLEVFARVSWKDRRLFSVSQTGLVN